MRKLLLLAVLLIGCGGADERPVTSPNALGWSTCANGDLAIFGRCS